MTLWFDFGDGNGTHLDSGLHAYAVDDMSPSRFMHLNVAK